MNKKMFAVASILAISLGLLLGVGLITLLGSNQDSTEEVVVANPPVWELTIRDGKAFIEGKSDNGYLMARVYCDKFSKIDLIMVVELSLNTGEQTGAVFNRRRENLEIPRWEFVDTLNDPSRDHVYYGDTRFSKSNYMEVSGKATKICGAGPTFSYQKLN